jgi:hypothetical protein
MKDVATSAQNEYPSGGATIFAPKAANFFYLPCRNQPSLPVTHHREAGLSSHASLPRR